MIVAKPRLPALSLSIPSGAFDAPGGRPAFYRKNNSSKRKKSMKPVEAGSIPFDKWVMPPQAERYIKSRDFDFF